MRASAELTPETFLRLLWPNADELPGQVNLWELGGKQSAWFRPGDREALSRKARRLAKTTDVYFGTALIDLNARLRAEAVDRGCEPSKIDPATVRGTNQTALAIPGIWIDVDLVLCHAGPEQ